jgi:phosphoribosylglycinamide formyltransferase-1
VARLAVGVLISGRGSNLQALLDACARPGFPAKIALVISNRSDASGLERAQSAGVPTQVIDHRDFVDRPAFETALTSALGDVGAKAVCLAGFMRVLTGGFVRAWPGRLLNIHPSLLPLFPGLDTHARALAAGVKLHGCTVHLVSEALDDGAIVGQAAVPVLPDDTAETLAARVLIVEHQLYPHCLRLLAEGRIEVSGKLTRITGAHGDDDTRRLINPEPSS